MDQIEVPNSDGARPSVQPPVNTEILVLFADLAQLLVMGLLLDVLLFGGVEVFGLVRLGVIAALLVSVLKSHGWLILFALQASLFAREPRRPEMMLGLVPWLYVITSVCLVAYACLGKSFRSRVSKWLVTQVLLVLGIERTVAEPSPPHSSSSSWVPFFAIQFMVWVVIVSVAMLALLQLPVTAAARSEWLRHAIENDSTIWPGATLLVLSLLLVIVFMEAGWRQMTGAQARLYLRSSFVVQIYGDLRMIVVRRLKMHKKLASAGLPQKQLIERVADTSPKL
jgi:hypothetical protein